MRVNGPLISSQNPYSPQQTPVVRRQVTPSQIEPTQKSLSPQEMQQSFQASRSSLVGRDNTTIKPNEDRNKLAKGFEQQSDEQITVSAQGLMQGAESIQSEFGLQDNFSEHTSQSKQVAKGAYQQAQKLLGLTSAKSLNQLEQQGTATPEQLTLLHDVRQTIQSAISELLSLPQDVRKAMKDAPEVGKLFALAAELGIQKRSAKGGGENYELALSCVKTGNYLKARDIAINIIDGGSYKNNSVECKDLIGISQLLLVNKRIDEVENIAFKLINREDYDLAQDIIIEMPENKRKEINLLIKMIISDEYDKSNKKISNLNEKYADINDKLSELSKMPDNAIDIFILEEIKSITSFSKIDEIDEKIKDMSLDILDLTNESNKFNDIIKNCDVVIGYCDEKIGISSQIGVENYSSYSKQGKGTAYSRLTTTWEEQTVIPIEKSLVLLEKQINKDAMKNVLKQVNMFVNNKLYDNKKHNGVLQSALANISSPYEIGQGSAPTCVGAVAEMMLAIFKPDEYLSIVQDITFDSLKMSGDGGLDKKISSALNDAKKQKGESFRNDASCLIQTYIMQRSNPKEQFKYKTSEFEKSKSGMNTKQLAETLTGLGVGKFEWVISNNEIKSKFESIEKDKKPVCLPLGFFKQNMIMSNFNHYTLLTRIDSEHVYIVNPASADSGKGMQIKLPRKQFNEKYLDKDFLQIVDSKIPLGIGTLLPTNKLFDFSSADYKLLSCDEFEP